MPTITIGAPIPAYRPHQGQYYLWSTIHFSHRHHYDTLWRDGFLFASVHTNIEDLCGGEGATFQLCDGVSTCRALCNPSNPGIVGQICGNEILFLVLYTGISLSV